MSTTTPDVGERIRDAFGRYDVYSSNWWVQLQRLGKVRVDGLSVFDGAVIATEGGFEVPATLYVYVSEPRAGVTTGSLLLSARVSFKDERKGITITALEVDVPVIDRTKPVQAYTHAEARRTNIPTAENQGLVPDEDKVLKTLRYPRNPDLDPQLVWRGKDREDEAGLEVQAPPVYIQEKIHPRAIVDDLKRRSATARGSAPQIDLFHDFNGLPDPEARTEFYEHDQNWSNRMILGDSLLVMASLAERERLRGQVQAIYFDPPYGIKFNSNWQPSTKSTEVKDNKLESVSREPEVVKAFRDTWTDKIHSYLSYLRDRLAVARDLLTDSGSMFVQIGDENVHLVRSLLDEIFGSTNFAAQIAFVKSSGLGSRLLSRRTDYILWYAKDIEQVKFRQPYVTKSRSEGTAETYSWIRDESGRFRGMNAAEKSGEMTVPDGHRIYKPDNITSQGNPVIEVEFEGKRYRLPSKTTVSGMERLGRAGRLHRAKNSLQYVRYLDDFPVMPVTELWEDTGTGSFTNDKVYVVQTGTKTIQRCLLMSTDPGDLVLDPTCGSGTTAYVAEQWGRRWIAIDTSRVALALARTRLMTARYDWYLPRDSPEGAAMESDLTGKAVAAPTGDHRPDLRQGFVYERAPRIKLGLIANDAGIDVIWDKWQQTLEPLRERLNAALGTNWQEWEIPREIDESVPAGHEKEIRALLAVWWDARRARQKEIDESIARGAEVELLYDRPYKAKGVVRVAGPFTVESLSPHRVLPLAEDPALLAALADHEGEEAPSAASREQTDFAQVVLQQLKAAGVQNTKKGEAIRFEWLKPFTSKRGYVNFEGVYLENGEERRAAVTIGPEYDTVGYELVRNAAREAADLFDTLIVCGFAFAPEVDESRLNFGRLNVLKARMNQDLHMADKLKATGAGNLFVVFGEPDIEVEEVGDDMIRVAIKGVDIFDPTTGQVKSSADPAEDIACWFIDDDYDEESFFVRQAYFLGRDPYESLKRALKAEIDEAAWAELNSTVSRAFPRPKSGRVCVKVINHFGDEVQKVFDVRPE